MNVFEAFRTFFLTYFNILTTTVLALLLLLLEKVLESEFKCPQNYTLAICYSLVLILAPCLILLLLGCKFSGGCCCNIYSFLQYSTPPAMWILIVLTDGDYLTCLFGKTSGVHGDLIKPIAKIVGLGCLCLLIGLRLFLASCMCGKCKEHLEDWYNQKYTLHLVKEFEEEIRRKAKNIHEAEVGAVIKSEYPDETFRTDSIYSSNWMKRLEEIVTANKSSTLSKLSKKADRNKNSETNNTNASGSTNGGAAGSGDGPGNTNASGSTNGGAAGSGDGPSNTNASGSTNGGAAGSGGGTSNTNTSRATNAESGGQIGITRTSGSISGGGEGSNNGTNKNELILPAVDFKESGGRKAKSNEHFEVESESSPLLDDIGV